MEGRYTREPVRTAMGLLGEGQLGLSKVLVLVDENTNARNFRDVLRAIRDHFDAREHFHLISRAPLDTLDFTSFKMHLGSRVILDATGSRSTYSGGSAPTLDPKQVAHTASAQLNFPPMPNVKKAVLWEDTMLVVQVDRIETDIGRKALEQLVRAPQLSQLKIIAVVSPDVNLDDDVDTMWGIFTRFDPARDVMFTHASLQGVQPLYDGVMGIDATWKPGYPDAVEMDPEVVRLVDKRWKEYWE